ncbi:phosphoenolpyruvate carboxylase isoform 1 [Artemisia annua]|uniref:Phosphoenolpyruvate carboxylase isoform 1 n=1 Tax=Artemisia annua TaxID=35608 RepID=A0A2U1P100_ARTAN|nr:phosphoenolpyruvate carboxylase isoform 1 [Artemisia annua]
MADSWYMLIRCDLGEPNVEPTPITHDARGPTNTVLKSDLEDPMMQFKVHNCDLMNAMYKAFTRKLNDAPHQLVCVNADPPVIKPYNSYSDDAHPSKAKQKSFCSATLEHGMHPLILPKPESRQLMKDHATFSTKDYRSIVFQEPRFVEYFATPETEYGRMTLGTAHPKGSQPEA